MTENEQIEASIKKMHDNVSFMLPSNLKALKRVQRLIAELHLLCNRLPATKADIDNFIQNSEII